MTERRHASANVAPSRLAFPQPRLRLGSYPRGTLTELLITLTLPSPSRREIHAMGGAVEVELGHHVGLGAFGQFTDPYQRSVADELRDVVAIRMDSP